jgi:pSer/pThr/pTyr-binding forkhead associated (FHA) protein
MWILQTTDRSEAGPFTFRLMPGAMKTLGRSTTADFILDAGMVSRFHCRVTVTPTGEIEIVDLESTNGTFVNDRRVHRGVLATGDRVRVGRVELLVMDARTVALSAGLQQPTQPPSATES